VGAWPTLLGFSQCRASKRREAADHLSGRHANGKGSASTRRSPAGDLARLATKLGFADQSHLSRVVRSETGRTPSALRHAPTQCRVR
jgi:AraC-like DNA-binding protein